MEKTERLASLDALRGFDMWFITGGSSFLVALAWLLTGTRETWIATQMTHVEWAGLRIYDLIFPLFLFISGVSFPYSCAKRREAGATTGGILRHILVRTLILIGLGLVYSRIQLWDWPHFRVWSVIGRVGISWGVAAALWTVFKPRTCAVITGVTLLVWWLLLALVPSPDAPAGAAPMATGANCIATWVDSNFLTTAHRHEGGLATLAMPPLTMLGIFAGAFLRWRPGALSGNRRTLVLLGAGAVSTALGGVLATCFGGLSLPIVKNVYSSSYSLIAGGIAFALLAMFYWVIDVKGWVKWSLYFRVIGANAVAVYMAHAFVPWKPIAASLLGALPKACAVPGWEALCLSTGALAVSWGVFFFLYRRKIFIKV
ncbi:MAG: DUF5009 domain-containing protein [Kiritimatiellae bacterium]|nr:DUF5009 domain-containing protein [Kiritimatiellia bacterium]